MDGFYHNLAKRDILQAMSKLEKGLYIANAWKSMVTDTARECFEARGWRVDGNWLNRNDPNPLHEVIIAAPAYFDAAILVHPKDYPSSKIFSYLIYPDEIVGWDFEENTYLRKKQDAFIPLLENTHVLSESRFVLDLVSSVYGNQLNGSRDITFLPVEFNKIFLEKTKAGTNPNKPIKVLWNHMWRGDKGLGEALALIDDLSERYSNVEFWIARDNLWGNNPNTGKLKEQTSDLLSRLRVKCNVFFQENFGFDRASEYWRFLTGFDIGFSVSYHEGFGLGMLEQAAAGIACVMPPRQSYPEIHSGGLITDNVAEGVAFLIENPNQLKIVSQKSQENASRFDAEDWAKNILEIIK
jgi:glycosyltransferase involved in cell wall biosynthesis